MNMTNEAVRRAINAAVEKNRRETVKEIEHRLALLERMAVSEDIFIRMMWLVETGKYDETIVTAWLNGASRTRATPAEYFKIFKEVCKGKREDIMAMIEKELA